VGYRSPAWEFSHHTIGILEDMGMLYSSNMMDTDEITRLSVFGRTTRLVELPVSWVLDDAPFWVYHYRLPGRMLQPLEAVYGYWSEEFAGLYAEGGSHAYVIALHPQIVGRVSRMRILERLIQFMKSYPGVWFATCREVAEEFDRILP
jgi:peptidoglycan/xylan/chitin deacetylase (PgdA/CDA1 family)